MASAAKSISVAPIGVETGPVAVPGAAEMFAAMIAGVGGDETSGEGAMPEAAPEEPADNPETQIDASVLLPMLDQQRAATPAAKLMAAPVDAATPEKVKVAGPKAGGETPVPIMPPLTDARPAPVEAAGPVPVMRPVATGKAAADAVFDPVPVMRPREDGKGAPATDTGKAPVMRPLDDGKPAAVKSGDPTPVMRRIDGGKPATIESADPTPVMRPADGSTPNGKAAPTASFAAADVPQPEVLAVAPKPVAPPQVKAADPKAADPKAAAPEVQAAAAEARAAPVAAQARQTRTATPATIEIRTETAGTSPAAAATATETRAAVQPVHAAPSLVQPLAAPVGAPVQNVAAALSQQVLDMSGGDAWIDQIARDISQTAGKDGTMRFRLAPETLGELKVEITHSERGAHVRLNVSSETAQQALVAAEHKLTAEARAQGVRIAETEIAFTGGQSRDASAQAHANAREQGQQQAQANNQPRTPRGTSTHSFTSSAAAPEGRGRTDRYA